MRTKTKNVLRSAMMAGGGTLVDSAYRGINKVIRRRRRARVVRRAAHILSRAGMFAAVIGIAYGAFAVFRNTRYQPLELN